ncbi:MAG: DNA recombination protein RmuC [Prevotellaceae bacterium]|nr:DNA recombination protein RmuC [Prevotellaceae bacterium]
MESSTIILTALVVALAAALFFVCYKLAAARQSIESHRARAEEAKAEAESSKERMREECERRLAEQKKDAAERLEGERKQWQENFERQTQLAREQMRSQFEREMRERSQALKQENQEQMGRIIDPMNKELQRLQQLMNESSKEQTAHISALKEGLKAVVEHDKERDKTTQSLAAALKNRGKVQGDWGEQVLEDILRDSGLREGHEYEKQKSFHGEKGEELRPDLIVYYPDKTSVVVDAKVSVKAYTEYVSAESEEERKKAEKDNLDSIWKQVTDLAGKDYPKVCNAIPTVLMFVPNEGSYVLAMNTDQQLGIKAYNKGVVIVNPTNLMLVLELIHIIWQGTRQDKNNQAILQAAHKIYEKFTTFADTFVTLGNQLATARTTYEKGLGQLREGRGNLSGQIQGLLRLGVNSPKRIPEQLLPLDTTPTEEDDEEVQS